MESKLFLYMLMNKNKHVRLIMQGRVRLECIVICMLDSKNDTCRLLRAEENERW